MKYLLLKTVYKREKTWSTTSNKNAIHSKQRERMPLIVKVLQIDSKLHVHQEQEKDVNQSL